MVGAVNDDRRETTAAWLAWDGPLHTVAGAVMTVGFGWAVVAGWDDMPGAVLYPFGAAAVVEVVMSVRELARRWQQRRLSRAGESSGNYEA